MYPSKCARINYNTRDEVRVLTTWSTMQARSSKVRVPGLINSVEHIHTYNEGIYMCINVQN